MLGDVLRVSCKPHLTKFCLVTENLGLAEAKPRFTGTNCRLSGCGFISIVVWNVVWSPKTKWWKWRDSYVYLTHAKRCSYYDSRRGSGVLCDGNPVTIVENVILLETHSLRSKCSGIPKRLALILSLIRCRFAGGMCVHPGRVHRASLSLCPTRFHW